MPRHGTKRKVTLASPTCDSDSGESTAKENIVVQKPKKPRQATKKPRQAKAVVQVVEPECSADDSIGPTNVGLSRLEMYITNLNFKQKAVPLKG